MSDAALTLLSLYPRQLGINGDSGNVLALAQRAAWRGITFTVLEHDIGDALPQSVDLVHIGSGPRTAQLAVQDDLARIAPTLREWKAAGVPVLAIAGGWQLLGGSITEEDGTVVPAAGLFATAATLVAKRTVGEIILDAAGESLAGFENHGAVVTLGAAGTPLGTVVAGVGSSGSAASRTEGVVEGVSIGTNLHGPFLPMNPAVADRLLASALALRGFATALASVAHVEAVDLAAANARAAIARRLGV